MRGSGKRGRWVFWSGVAALVPGLYFASLTPNAGMPEALGCSAGAGSEPDIPDGVANLYQPEWPVAIDSSGFFAFAIGTHGIEPDAALEALSVDVRDEAGQPVAGNAVVLDHEAGDASEVDTVWIGWQADEPLELEDRLTFTSTATNSEKTVSMSGKLVVSGPAPALGEPEASFQPWVETTVDTGELMECSGCFTFGTEVQTRYHSLVDLAGARPELNVAWKYSIEAIDGKGELVEGSTVYVTSPLSSFSDVGMEVDFMDLREEYCLRVTAEDLRSGEEYSTEVCSAPETPLAESIVDGITNCHFDEVPEAYRKRYCSYSDEDDERCAPYLDAGEPPVGTGGKNTGGSGTGGANTGGKTTGGKNTGGSTGGASSETTGGAPPDDGAPQAAPHGKSKAGCSFDGEPAHQSGYAALSGLGLFALAVARRRRARR